MGVYTSMEQNKHGNEESSESGRAGTVAVFSVPSRHLQQNDPVKILFSLFSGNGRLPGQRLQHHTCLSPGQPCFVFLELPKIQAGNFITRDRPIFHSGAQT